MIQNTILIVEDHPLIVQGLSQILLQINPELKILETDNCESFIQLVTDLQIHYCIVDLNLVDGMAFDSIENILKLYPTMNILVYTSFPGDMYARHLFKMGIHGFLSKKAPKEELYECLTNFLQEEFYISKEFLPLIFKSRKEPDKLSINPFDLLSLKEMIVVEYLLEGISTKVISEKLSVMPSTTATYKKRAFQKLEIENIIQLHSLYQTHCKKTPPVE